MTKNFPRVSNNGQYCVNKKIKNKRMDEDRPYCKDCSASKESDQPANPYCLTWVLGRQESKAS